MKKPPLRVGRLRLESRFTAAAFYLPQSPPEVMIPMFDIFLPIIKLIASFRGHPPRRVPGVSFVSNYILLPRRAPRVKGKRTKLELFNSLAHSTQLECP